MKILEVVNVHTDSESQIIDSLLKQGFVNESLFAESYFKIKIKLDKKEDDCVNQLYRMLWETLCLHQSSRSFFDRYGDEGTFFNMYLSLVDAIGFIRFATPPILQNRIKDSITSKSQICDVLQAMLIDSNNEYYGYFSQFTNMMPFDTVWQQNDDKVDLMYNRIPNNPSISLEAYDVPFKSIYTNNFDGILLPSHVQCSINIPNKSMLFDVAYKLFVRYVGFKLNIVNIKKRDDDSIVISFYMQINSHKGIPARIHELIESSYDTLMK